MRAALCLLVLLGVLLALVCLGPAPTQPRAARRGASCARAARSVGDRRMVANPRARADGAAPRTAPPPPPARAASAGAEGARQRTRRRLKAQHAHRFVRVEPPPTVPRGYTHGEALARELSSRRDAVDGAAYVQSLARFARAQADDFGRGARRADPSVRPVGGRFGCQN